MHVHALDIKNAFLNGVLEEGLEVWMEQPPGYGDGRAGYGCLLRKTLYGLKQAPREWHKVLAAALRELGLQPAQGCDPSLWVKPSTAEGAAVYVIAYVDDLLCASTCESSMEAVKRAVLARFKARDLGRAERFLGIMIHPTDTGIAVHQAPTVRELLRKYGMVDAKPRSLPLAANTKLLRATAGDSPTAQPYAEVVGALLWLSNCTCPDITATVHALARHMAAPTEAHWAAAMGVLRYLAGTVGVALHYDRGAGGLTGWCDSDYAGCPDTRRSVSAHVFIHAGGAVAWSSKLQATVACSTAEAEYLSAAAAAKEASWLRHTAAAMGIACPAPLALRCDNQAALQLAHAEGIQTRTKHIGVAAHYVRDCLARRVLQVSYVSTHENAADFLTKAVPINKHRWCARAVGLRNGI